MVEQITLRDKWGSLAVTISCKAIVRDSDKIWLRKNERGDWELPGGRLDELEQPEETVVREIREELGVNLANLTLVDAYIWKKNFGSTTHVELLTFSAVVSETIGEQELMGEAGRAEFAQFTIPDALNLENLPEPYKRSLKKYEDN